MLIYTCVSQGFFPSEEERTAVLDARDEDLEACFFPAQHRALLMPFTEGLQLSQPAALRISLPTHLLTALHASAAQAYPDIQKAIRDVILVPIWSVLPHLLPLPGWQWCVSSGQGSHLVFTSTCPCHQDS